MYENLVKASETKDSGAVPMILLQFHPEFYKTPTAHNMEREIVDRLLNFKMSVENEAFWNILSDSADAHRAKQAAIKQLAEVHQPAQNEKMTKTTLGKIEGNRAHILEIYKKNLYEWKKTLFTAVINNPLLLAQYLRIPVQNEVDSFSEEREALKAVLIHDPAFLKTLVEKNGLNQLKKMLQKVDPLLYATIEKGSLKPYLNPTPSTNV